MPDCEILYKFLTHGGLEANREHLYKQEFDWWYSLPDIAQFDSKCCAKLRSEHPDAPTAWLYLGAVALKLNSDCPCSGLWHTCSRIQPAPNKAIDYFHYLNSDGYEHVPLSRIDHCR